MQPHVDAADMEQVSARRQPPDNLAFLHKAQAHRTLRPPAPAAATAALATAGAAANRQAPTEHERRQRGHRGGAQPTVVGGARQEERPGRHVHDGSPRAAAAAAAAQAFAEDDDEDGDGGGAEADGEEHKRVVRAVAALVRRVGQRVGVRRQRHDFFCCAQLQAQLGSYSSTVVVPI